MFKVTNHEEVISQSLCVEETKTKVVSYLSKVSDNSLKSLFEIKLIHLNETMFCCRLRMQRKMWIYDYRGSRWRQQKLSGTTTSWKITQRTYLINRRLQWWQIQRLVASLNDLKIYSHIFLNVYADEK